MEGLHVQTVEEASRDESDVHVAQPGALAALLGVIASWIILRPYVGIVHDALLYYHFAEFGDRPAFRDLDVVVANDEQMGRSLFVPVVRPLVRAFGMATTALATTALGLVSWVAAVAVLAKVLVGRFWWILTIAIPAFGAYWGPLFLIAEPFSTPRVFAEAAVILAIAAALVDRRIAAAAGLVVALVLHPIIGLSGVAVVLVLLTLDSRRWLGIVCAVAIIGVLVAAWDPIGLGGAKSFSAAWLSVIADRASLVLPGEWHPIAWVNTFFGFAMVGALYMSTRNDRLKRLSLASIGVGAAGLATSVVFSWVVVRPFVTQVQPWRALWVLHLVAIIAVVVFALDAWRERRPETTLRALAALVLALTAGTRGIPLVGLALGLACLPLLYPAVTDFQRKLVNDRMVRVMGIVVGLIAGAQLVGGLVAIAVGDATAIPFVGIAARVPALTLLIAAAVLAAVSAQGRGGLWRAVGFGLLAGAIAFGILSWDHRNDWQKYSEGIDEAVIALPDDALVLVEYEGIAAATLTERPIYYTGYAGAGVVFSEPLALVYDQHARVSRSVGVPYAWDYRLGEERHRDVVAPTAADLAAACEDPLGPTHLLLRRAAPGVPGQIWRSPVMVDDVPERDVNPVFLDDGFILYACDDIAG